MKRLIEIQSKLKAPKNQKNKFGNYYYRNCEDILEAVKPLLKEQNLSIVISDDVISTDGRFYIVATVSLYDENGKEVAKSTALARETEVKKGMDEAQITGAASSYARKYALNGLFAIDDTKDADATKGQEPSRTVEEVKEVFKGKEINVNPVDVAVEIAEISDVIELKRYKSSHKDIWNADFEGLYNERLKVLKGE